MLAVILKLIISIILLLCGICCCLAFRSYGEQIQEIKNEEAESWLYLNEEKEIIFRAHPKLEARKLYQFEKEKGLIPIVVKDSADFLVWKDKLKLVKDVWAWEKKQLADYETYVRNYLKEKEIGN